MDNDPDHDSGILQMGLVVSDAETKGNGNFDEAVDSDQEGSEPPPLIDPSSNEKTSQRNAVDDVLLGLNDPVPSTFGSSLQPLTANHEWTNHLESNCINMNNNNPMGCREIHYIMLHVLSTMANLSPNLLGLDDDISAHGDGNLLKEAHFFTSQWFQDLNHLSGIILMNTNNNKNVISSSDTWERIYNKLVNDFLRITPRTK